MKVKDLEKTVNLAWSPRSQYPILLAAGTTAQQLDASFSTTASLDIYSVNLGDPSMDLELRHSVTSDLRLVNLGYRFCATDYPDVYSFYIRPGFIN